MGEVVQGTLKGIFNKTPLHPMEESDKQQLAITLGTDIDHIIEDLLRALNLPPLMPEAIIALKEQIKDKIIAKIFDAVQKFNISQLLANIVIQLGDVLPSPTHQTPDTAAQKQPEETAQNLHEKNIQDMTSPAACDEIAKQIGVKLQTPPPQKHNKMKQPT